MQENKKSDAGTNPSASLSRLFLSFFKIGAFTFGGGWAMISIIEREIVDKYHWIEKDEFLDLLAIAQSLPGILAVNIATSVGDKLRGTKGSIVASLGTILPSFLIILAIAIFLTPDMIKSNRVISSIFMGIRPAVVALIIAPVITSAKAAKLTWKTVWIPLLVALLISIDAGFISNPILYIVLGGVGGWLLWWLPRRGASRKEK
ncbi:MAG: chromate transporter [Bacteroides sp.]|nr:chromate transporter [Bacteroides sp.]